MDADLRGDDLTLTDLTGHPTLVVPSGSRKGSTTGRPDTISRLARHI